MKALHVAQRFKEHTLTGLQPSQQLKPIHDLCHSIQLYLHHSAVTILPSKNLCADLKVLQSAMTPVYPYHKPFYPYYKPKHEPAYA